MLLPARGRRSFPNPSLHSFIYVRQIFFRFLAVSLFRSRGSYSLPSSLPPSLPPSLSLLLLLHFLFYSTLHGVKVMLLVRLGHVLLVGGVEITRQNNVTIFANGLEASLLKEGRREGEREGREGRKP